MSAFDAFADAFRVHGTAHTPGLVPVALCDALVSAWRAEVRPHPGPLRRQDTLRTEVHRLSSDGFVVNPVFDVHRQDRFPGFAGAAEDLVEGSPLRRCAEAALGGEVRWLQSAYFESSEGTPPHRDDAPFSADGEMIGAWVALEDIVMEAGPFVLWPGSRDWVDPELDALGRAIRTRLGQGDPDVGGDAAAYHSRLAVLLEGRPRVACLVSAGDVVWWDRRVFHGALQPVVGSGRSRSSLVVHFVPA